MIAVRGLPMPPEAAWIIHFYTEPTCCDAAHRRSYMLRPLTSELRQSAMTGHPISRSIAAFYG